MRIVNGGPPNPGLPFRYGCICGAVWNSSVPLKLEDERLCGPFCGAVLSPLSSKERDDEPR